MMPDTHTVQLADDGTITSATCNCRWEALSTDRAAVVDAAENHAFANCGSLEFGKLRPRPVQS